MQPLWLRVGSKDNKTSHVSQVQILLLEQAEKKQAWRRQAKKKGGEK